MSRLFIHCSKCTIPEYDFNSRGTGARYMGTQYYFHIFFSVNLKLLQNIKPITKLFVPPIAKGKEGLGFMMTTCYKLEFRKLT
jgi:hypothetical protein